MKPLLIFILSIAYIITGFSQDSLSYGSRFTKFKHHNIRKQNSTNITDTETFYYANGGLMTKAIYRHNYDSLVFHKNYDENGNELKLSHYSRNTKTNEILNLLLGVWVYIRDTTLQITITKKEIFVSEHNDMGDYFWGESGHDRYTLQYIDSTMKKQWGGLFYIDGWAGYALISKQDHIYFFNQIFSINSKYMVLSNDLVFKKKVVSKD